MGDKEMKNATDIQHVFIIGSKGIPARYGGFESFVEKLTQYQKSNKIKYHVSAIVDRNKSNTMKEFVHNGAHCFNIKIPNFGAAKAVLYDIAALKYCINYIKKYNLQNPIVYVLACRIGPFINHYKKQIMKLGGFLYVNPDGHEWKRAKWSAPIRKYWKISEQLMVKHADLLICDSRNIEKYIQTDYAKYKPKTTFIAYGAETGKSTMPDDDLRLLDWYKKRGLKIKDYYLVVGRFVPENNYETMIREFMKSNSTKSFALITGITDAFLNELKNKTGFDNDTRIKFVGTVYDQELLKKIRENAYGYLHGHEVGGTNPSLLEALGSTDLNLLLDVGFNREVGEDGAIYWEKDEESLARVIEKADNMSIDDIKQLGILAKRRISEEYSWDYIVKRYENVFWRK
jgi:rhamnosyltransferase